jgi:hypothetical protein
LPVFATWGETYRFVWEQRRLLWTLAVLPIIVISLMAVLGILLVAGYRLSMGETSGALAGALVAVTLLIVSLLIVVALYFMFMVAWHRVYLVPEETSTAASAYRWGRRQTNFVLSNLRAVLAVVSVVPIGLVPYGVIFAVAKAVGGEAGLPPRWLAELAMAIIALSIPACLFVMARLVLVLPAAALDVTAALRRSWDLSRGNAWRLFWATGLAEIPLVILAKIEEGVRHLFFGEGPDIPLSVALVTALFRALIFTVQVAVGVTVLSISYRRLSTMPSPTAIAGGA